MHMRRHAQFPVTRSVLRARPSRRSAAVYTAGANIRARKRGTESITLFSACEYVYSHHYTKRPPGPPLTPRARGTRVSAAFIAMLLASKPPGRAPVTVLFSARAKCTCTLATMFFSIPHTQPPDRSYGKTSNRALSSRSAGCEASTALDHAWDRGERLQQTAHRDICAERLRRRRWPLLSRTASSCCRC